MPSPEPTTTSASAAMSQTICLGLSSPVDEVFDGQRIVRPDRVPYGGETAELVLADLPNLDHRGSLARRRPRSRLEARFPGTERRSPSATRRAHRQRRLSRARAGAPRTARLRPTGAAPPDRDDRRL